jgi:hypothetical protein
MAISRRARETGKRLLGEYLEASAAARNQMPPAHALEPGETPIPYPMTPEKLAEWDRLDAAEAEAKARWRAWMGDPEGYSGS